MRTEIEELVIRAGCRGDDALVAGVLADGEATVHCRRGEGALLAGRTLFEIGSLTKPFTGALLADMYLRGEVRLDDPVSEYLPEADLPRWKLRAPTREELATHRAALPNAPRGLNRRKAAFALGLRSSDLGRRRRWMILAARESQSSCGTAAAPGASAALLRWFRSVGSASSCSPIPPVRSTGSASSSSTC